MVQTLLTLAFGFLFAAFIAVAAAPSIWQRAVALTRKRIEASVPLTLNELQADKDQLRAEFAMIVRKLELGIKSTRERLTHAQVQVARLEADQNELLGERNQLNAKISEQVLLLSERADQIERNTNAINALERRRAELTQLLDESTSDSEAKEARINDLMIDADSRRIELAATMTEQGRLSGIIADARSARTVLEQNLRSTANELRAAHEVQRAEKRRIAELEKKSDRLAAHLSDREERLARREQELDAIKGQLKATQMERSELERKYATSERQRVHLESHKGTLPQQTTKAASVSNERPAGKPVSGADAEHARPLEMIERLSREKAMLEEASRTVNFPVQVPGNDILREKMHELTAKVVKLTIDAEGTASPIPALLAKADKKPSPAGSRAQELPVSLAERIRALEHAARRN